jgi:hypothetical protein
LSRDGAIENMEIVDAQPKNANAARPASTTSLPPKKQLAIRFHNTGEMPLVAKGHLEFRRLDNSLAREVPVEEFPTLSGATRRVLVDIPADLPVGDYVVLALIDFGGAELVAGQIDYQAK